MSAIRQLRELGPRRYLRWQTGKAVNIAFRRHSLRKLPKHSVGIEIGVWTGEFSRQILKVVRPHVLHLVDPWRVFPNAQDPWYDGSRSTQEEMDARHHLVCERFKRQIANGTVQVHRSTSEEATRLFPDQSLDWVYVDGDHSYEGVSGDIAMYLPKLRVGGYILGDDYGTSSDAWWGDAIIRAVSEALERDDVKKVRILWTQWLLQKVE